MAPLLHRAAIMNQDNHMWQHHTNLTTNSDTAAGLFSCTFALVAVCSS